ncbi:putative disease resistance protein RGA1 isoform X1 [Carya illinoinensis]|uniref:Uncharacterized protein n=1 Tax=Carya illinoinensis TaxID=32201 RepID=A0A8T1NPS9_CARIL|nr:putative disease resistance protein RGA1 isoform X1 [Carya illinoinensis]KAG6632385.1 hypothetical protein CIPAW_13G155600 [Carya illinoinensis]KAG6632386.1 hypothetical protein CIPAW_13G155600 [Carya illinoinensis]
MEKSKLINLWIAQGFIKPSNQNECLEDVGHDYFMDLLWRSFFQEAEMDDWGNVFTIKMHDLMHDLAMSEAGSLITRLESEEKIIGDQKTRHVSVVGNIDFSSVIPTSSSSASKIRTLLCLGEFNNLHEYSSTSCEAIFSSLKFLRVLGLHGRQLDLVPSSMCMLKHLRDLDLSGNGKIEKLLDSISRLQNLYTLRLSGCTRLKELPRGITKLVNLRHLYNDGCYSLTYMPHGLGQLTNLQTLSKFVVCSNSGPEDGGRLSELNRLNSLGGELEIWDLRHDGDDFALDYKGNLKAKEHLQVLYLWCSTENIYAFDEMALEGLEPHPNLKKLEINVYGGVRVPMWLLSLTNLVDLKLSASWKPVQQTITNASSSSASSTPIAFSSPPLSKLKRIYLYQIEDLETLPVQNLISLQQLTIADCQRLKSLSQGVQYLTALQKLELSDCPVLDLGNDEHGMQWKGLKSLISLEFTRMPKLVSLPLGLQHVTTLRKLQISDCSSLVVIPEWICNWASLEEFTIYKCSGLTSRPEAMSRLNSL